jgi:hypothetical protein
LVDPVHDLTGMTFSYLAVIEYAKRKRNSLWRVRCVCGTEKFVSSTRLRSGRVKSCGCKRSLLITKHGEPPSSPEYVCWCRIKSSCLNPHNPQYGNYGGRGITVYEPWSRDFATFLRDVGRRPQEGYSLDRIDNDKGYSPGNVRWVTGRIQQSNRRNNVQIEWRGETKCLSAWSRIVNMRPGTLHARIKSGWNIERIMTEPLRKRSYRSKMRSDDTPEDSDLVNRITSVMRHSGLLNEESRKMKLPDLSRRILNIVRNHAAEQTGCLEPEEHSWS